MSGSIYRSCTLKKGNRQAAPTILATKQLDCFASGNGPRRPGIDICRNIASPDNVGGVKSVVRHSLYLEVRIAAQCAAGCRDLGRASGRTGWYGGGDFGRRDNIECCRGAVESDAEFEQLVCARFVESKSGAAPGTTSGQPPTTFRRWPCSAKRVLLRDDSPPTAFQYRLIVADLVTLAHGAGGYHSSQGNMTLLEQDVLLTLSARSSLSFWFRVTLTQKDEASSPFTSIMGSR